MTKSMGIAGLRLGYVLTSNPQIKRALRNALPIWNVNAVAEFALETFPRYRREHRESLERIVDGTRWFADALREVPYLDPFPTQTNAVFCGVRGSAHRLTHLLFERHGFIVKDGIQQGTLKSVQSYVRIGFRNREDNARLLAALHDIEASV